MSAGKVGVVADLRNVEALYDLDLSQTIAAVAELIKAAKVVVRIYGSKDPLADSPYCARLRAALARVQP